MTEILPLIVLMAGPIALALIVFLLIRFARRRNLERLMTTLRGEAAARGWTISSEVRGELQVLQWRGSTAGIGWMAESLWGNRGQHDPDSLVIQKSRRVSLTRWQTSGLRGSTGPVILMGMCNNLAMPASWPG